MKALYFLPALALTMLASCGGSKKTESTTTEEPATPTVETYAGTMPGADVEGIRYTLTLNYTGQRGSEPGDFTLTEVYISDLNPATDTIEGQFEQLSEANVSYLRLISKPAFEGNPIDTLYMVVTSDSTLMLTGADLQPAASGLDYTLTKQ